MRQVQGSLSKTDGTKRARYYTLMEARWLPHRLVLREERQFSRKRTQVERHDEHIRLSPPLSHDGEVSLYFLSWWVK